MIPFWSGLILLPNTKVIVLFRTQCDYSSGVLPRHELHRKGVHTMTTVSCSKAFSKENVAQMATAVDTLDLRSLTIRIG